MSRFSQDTDPGATPGTFIETSTLSQASSSTPGSDDISWEFPLAQESHLLGPARRVIPQVADGIVAQQAEELLYNLHLLMRYAQNAGLELNNVPPIHMHILDDKSVSMEWLFPDFRVGFNIEPDPDESGWHLVANKKLKELTLSGQLADKQQILEVLFTFVLTYV